MNEEEKKAIQAMIDKAHAQGNLDDMHDLEHLQAGREGHVKLESGGYNYVKLDRLMRLYGPEAMSRVYPDSKS